MSDNNQTQLPIDQLRQIRIEKINKLTERGINSFPSTAKRSHTNKVITEDFTKLENKEVNIVGRIMSLREHGVIAFADLEDSSGVIQLYIKQDSLSKPLKTRKNLGFEDLNLLDIGDFIEVTGVVTKTQRGQISVMPKYINLLTKSIRPLPSKHFGLKDDEDRYRQRYVDLALNSELREMFVKKAIFWNSMRDFLVKKGFLEVETPVIENTAGGADAEPFITHHNALDIDVYLRISMGELWQKRLMVGMYEKTFEIGRQFRNEGMSREHLQDYTQMEFYWAYANYEDSMEVVEEMYKHVAKKTFGTLKFTIAEHKIDLSKKWEKIRYRDILIKRTGIDLEKVTEKELIKKLSDLKAEFNPNDDKARLIDTLWKQIRKDISGPAFLVGHPVEVSPLAKRDPKNPNYVERYQIILAGSEMGNGYSELNDPIDQAQRFEKQQAMRDAGDGEAQMHDEDFVRALEYGMPPVTGFGVSERLFSFLADKSVRECVMFPLLRPENVQDD